ncbi:hypothetical protein BwSH14_43610 [Bradyrhizobium ottawaense]|nr:hypothetical protein BwSH14_43610 [Bradyrhizobium ottawaense]
MAEDPFATHVIIQSADKILTDVAKKSGRALAFDFGEFIKPEYRKQWFGIHRETYNFLKHADRDPSGELGVRRIAETNAAELIMAVENYAAVFGAITEHMSVIRVFARLWKPNWFHVSEDPKVEELRAQLRHFKGHTPYQFFRTLVETRINSPGLLQEKQADIADAFGFYSEVMTGPDH